jgi:hypothetical protein
MSTESPTHRIASLVLPSEVDAAHGNLAVPGDGLSERFVDHLTGTSYNTPFIGRRKGTPDGEHNPGEEWPLSSEVKLSGMEKVALIVVGWRDRQPGETKGDAVNRVSQEYLNTIDPDTIEES